MALNALFICGEDQGEESIVLVDVVVGGLFFSFPCKFFWGAKRQKLCLQRGVKRQHCVYHGALIS